MFYRQYFLLLLSLSGPFTIESDQKYLQKWIPPIVSMGLYGLCSYALKKMTMNKLKRFQSRTMSLEKKSFSKSLIACNKLVFQKQLISEQISFVTDEGRNYHYSTIKWNNFYTIYIPGNDAQRLEHLLQQSEIRQLAVTEQQEIDEIQNCICHELEHILYYKKHPFTSSLGIHTGWRLKALWATQSILVGLILRSLLEKQLKESVLLTITSWLLDCVPGRLLFKNIIKEEEECILKTQEGTDLPYANFNTNKKRHETLTTIICNRIS